MSKNIISIVSKAVQSIRTWRKNRFYQRMADAQFGDYLNQMERDNPYAEAEAADEMAGRELIAEWEAEDKAMRADWNALNLEEQAEEIDTMDIMAEQGFADSHRFYPYWKTRRCG